MSLFSLNRAPVNGMQSFREKWPLVFEWLDLSNQHDLEKSILSLTDAFNDLEESVAPITE